MLDGRVLLRTLRAGHACRIQLGPMPAILAVLLRPNGQHMAPIFPWLDFLQPAASQPVCHVDVSAHGLALHSRPATGMVEVPDMPATTGQKHVRNLVPDGTFTH